MSWKSGSELFDKIIQILGDNIYDYDTRESIYLQLISAFEEIDCDTLYECLEQDKAFDAAYKQIYEINDKDDAEDDYDSLDD